MSFSKHGPRNRVHEKSLITCYCQYSSLRIIILNRKRKHIMTTKSQPIFGYVRVRLCECLGHKVTMRICGVIRLKRNTDRTGVRGKGREKDSQTQATFQRHEEDGAFRRPLIEVSKDSPDPRSFMRAMSRLYNFHAPVGASLVM